MSTWADSYQQREDVQAYKTELVAQHGFEEAELEALFNRAQRRDDILEKISRPAERVWTWARYKKHLVDEARIQAGIEFYRDHRETLMAASQAYGVAPHVIVAILGIETRYGQVKGSYPVLDSLFTLGFDYPPRSKFFRKELTEFLLLAREEGKDPTQITGSYAGAMGYGQFIPSSYRYYAVDFDEDGVRDIWDNRVDAIGSIANYFAKHKWQGAQPTAIRVEAPEGLPEGLVDNRKLDLLHTVADLQRAGVDTQDLSPELKARLYRVEGEEGTEYWVALHDFYVITRYNRSHLYALAVHHLAEAIKAGVGN